jgi:DNA-directed RNA polymerase specialized sigma24 family protein
MENEDYLERRCAVRWAINNLPELLRQVMFGCPQNSRTMFAELAEESGLSEGTVEQLFRRAERRLRPSV